MDSTDTAMEMKLESADKTPDGPDLYFVRLNNDEIRQHFVFVVCFIVLAVTGVMDWLPDKAFQFLGGAKETVFIIRSAVHRTFGTIMILTSIYHVFYLLFRRAGRRWLVDMMPIPKDLKDFIHNMLYYVGIRKTPPEFDRFSYKHKAEYGALIVGTVLMSASGVILWTEFFWNKFVVDIAALIHGMEAVLACLAIIVWHLYEVHLRPHKFPLDDLWLTGVIDEAEMKEEYPLHYRKIMKDPDLQKIYIREGMKRNG